MRTTLIFFRLRSILPSDVFLLGFPIEFCVCLLYFTCATCPVHLNFLDFITFPPPLPSTREAERSLIPFFKSGPYFTLSCPFLPGGRLHCFAWFYSALPDDFFLPFDTIQLMQSEGDCHPPVTLPQKGGVPFAVWPSFLCAHPSDSCFHLLSLLSAAGHENPCFMGLEDSSPHSQNPAIGTYHEPFKSSLNFHFPYFEHKF